MGHSRFMLNWDCAISLQTARLFSVHMSKLTLKKFTLIFHLLLSVSMTVNAQTQGPEIEWERAYGGSNSLWFPSAIIQNEDSAYIICGVKAFSSDKDWEWNIWLMKLNSHSEIVWNKTFRVHPEENYNPFATSFIKTGDGGYAICGAERNGTNFHPWFIKLNNRGDIILNKTLNDDGSWPGYEKVVRSIFQTHDGGYALCGYKYRYNAQDDGGWVIRLDSNGRIIWSKIFNYKDEESDFHSIIQTLDGNIAVFGHKSTEVSKDFLVIKLNTNGEIIWEKRFDYNSWDEAQSIIQTKDGGYALLGTTGAERYGSRLLGDIQVIKLNSLGEIVWNKKFGDTNLQEASSIIRTDDGGYIICGNELLIDGNPSSSYIWVLKLNELGERIWEETYGGTDDEDIRGSSIMQTQDGGYIICGDKGAKAWVIKLKGERNVSPIPSVAGPGVSTTDSTKPPPPAPNEQFIPLPQGVTFRGTDNPTILVDGEKKSGISLLEKGVVLADELIQKIQDGCHDIEIKTRYAVMKLYFWKEDKKLKSYTPFEKSYAVIIAVSKYGRDTGYKNLDSAVPQARELANYLRSIGFQVKEFYDEYATKDNIENYMLSELKPNVNDRVLFYFGGHGKTAKGASNEDQGFLITYDCTPNNYKIKAIKMTDVITRYAEDVNAKHVLFTIDACFSGLALSRDSDISQKELERFKKLTEIEVLTKERGRDILVAGKSGERALDLNGGIFTKALIRGINGLSDSDKNGVVTIDELKAYIRNEVATEAKLHGFTQTPSASHLDKFGTGQFIFIVTN